MIIENRLAWMDVAKGIAIILMIIGHTSIPDGISNFIFSFHMPLFFIASGWCTKWERDSFSRFIIKKLRNLGLPYIVYSVIVLLFARCIGYSEISLDRVLTQGWGGYALWFVPVLFFSLVIARLVLLIPQKWLRITAAFSLMLIGAAFSFHKVSMPWTLCTIPYATFLVLVGARMKAFNRFIERPQYWEVLLCIIITAVVAHYWRLDLASNVVTPVIPLTIAAIAGTLMVFFVAQYIVIMSGKLTKVWQAIGKQTFMIMAFSQIIIVALKLHTGLGSLMRYICMAAILVVIALVKDNIIRIIGKKFLR